jgi:MFS family permease
VTRPTLPTSAASPGPAAGTGPGAAPRAYPVSLWRNRDYLCWWSGTAFSLVGSNVSAIAFPLLIVFSTGSVLGAGVIAAAGRVGSLVTTLWGGALADRVSRRLILVTIPLAQAVIMGLVAWSVHRGEALILPLACAAGVNGLLAGIGSGATLPALRRIVPREQFAARAAQEQGLQQATQLVGSPLAAFLYTASRWLPFAADSLSYLFASAGSALIRRPLGPDRMPNDIGEPAHGRRRAARTRTLTDIRGGLRVVRGEPFLRYMTVWIAGVNMVGNSFVLLLIVLLKDHGAAPRTIGLINSVVLAGGILGALVTSALIRGLGSRRVFLLGGWTYVITLATAALSTRQWQIAAAAFVFVFASVPTASVWEAYTASLVPDRLIGRVGSIFNFAAQSLTWVGMLLAGLLADQLGASVATLCFAGLLIPFAIAGHTVSALTLLHTPLDRVEELP